MKSGLFVLSLLLLVSCQKRYKVVLKTESTLSFPTFNVPEEKEISAYSDVKAYEKAAKLVLELEQQNSSNDYVYTDFSLFYAKSGDYVNIGLMQPLEIKEKYFKKYVEERLSEKKRKTSGSPLLEYQEKYQQKIGDHSFKLDTAFKN